MQVGAHAIYPGKVQKQLDGPDQQDYAFSVSLDGRPFEIRVLLSAGQDPAAVAEELRSRAVRIGEMFAGTPVWLSYDSQATRVEGGLAAAHTAAQLAGS